MRCCASSKSPKFEEFCVPTCQSWALWASQTILLACSMKSCCLRFGKRAKKIGMSEVVGQFQRWSQTCQLLKHLYHQSSLLNSRTSTHQQKFPPLPHGPNISQSHMARCVPPQEFLTIWIIIHLLRLPRGGRGILGRRPGNTTKAPGDVSLTLPQSRSLRTPWFGKNSDAQLLEKRSVIL